MSDFVDHPDESQHKQEVYNVKHDLINDHQWVEIRGAKERVKSVRLLRFFVKGT
jgi:hypothetical protein